jgi:hypothetical protein
MHSRPARAVPGVAVSATDTSNNEDHRPSPMRSTTIPTKARRRGGRRAGGGGGAPPHGQSARVVLSSIWSGYKRLTTLGFPRRFPMVQFPNPPLIVAFLAGEAALVVHGAARSDARSVGYLGMTVWAWEEAVNGVNWFRHLLGLTYAVILIMRVAHALH